MKKIIAYFASILIFASCENSPFDYKDFDYQTVYFPFQYPVRTLSLGNDKIDNSLDKQHIFHIGVSIGGIYLENSKSWSVNYTVDNSLVENYLVNANNDTLIVLPPSYYSLDPTGIVTIPSGSFSGLIKVQLTEDFFSDPKAVKGNYVIPLKITDSSADSILSGKALPDLPTPPNRHVESDWLSQMAPKDYTLFGIKYINPYHGTWLRRSLIEEKDPVNGSVIQTINIRSEYVERDQLVKLTTNSMTEVISNFVGDNFSSNMSLTIAGNTVTVGPVPGAALAAEGTGTFETNGQSWGGKSYDALYLNYTYSLPNGNICAVLDTLVLRDRGIIVEEARPTLIIP